MDGRKIQNRINYGLGRSARFIGQWADAFRPTGPSNPLDTENRYLKLPVAFLPSKGSGNRTNSYGEPLWHGIYDTAYTRVGDYIVLGSRVFFVASQDPLLPVLCVSANRTISIMRPYAQGNTAGNSYGGYTLNSSTLLMSGWPANVLGENRSGSPLADLPINVGMPYWNVLIPSVANVILSPGDLVADDLGRTAVITGSELTDLGWRIYAKLAIT